MKKAAHCLYCDAPEDFIIRCEKEIYFCKKCDKFYSKEEAEIECSDCKSLDSSTLEEKRLIDKAISECKGCKITNKNEHKRAGKKTAKCEINARS